LFLRSPGLRHWTAPAAQDGPDGEAPQSRRAVLALVLATGAIGLCLGGLGLVVVAFSQSRHDPAAVAWIEAVQSAGSALGGLGYGGVTWRVPAERRLAGLAAGLAVVLIPAALSPGLVVLGLLIGLAGALVAPALATAYVLADSLAVPGGRNRAANWVGTGFNAGSSAGSVLSGQLVGRLALGACLPVLAGPAVLAVLPLLRARPRSAAGPGG
jgi:hypothetical protein